MVMLTRKNYCTKTGNKQKKSFEGFVGHLFRFCKKGVLLPLTITHKMRIRTQS